MKDIGRKERNTSYYVKRKKGRKTRDGLRKQGQKEMYGR